MTPNDFDTIEGQLGVRLPPAYLELLGRGTAQSPRVVGKFELYADPRFVVNETTRLRLGDFGGDARPAGELLVIGDDGCGNYCFLDLGQEPPGVVGYDHETDSYAPLAWSLEQWIRTSGRRVGNG